MTKFCQKCGAENKDTAVFCEKCGSNLGTNVNASQPSKTSNSGGFMGWWNKQGTGGKAAVALAGLCCVGLILIVAVGGMMSPDKTTTTNTSTTTASTTQAPVTTWHSVANFTGSGDKNTPSFQTQGNKFKVVINATASSPEYASISFFAYPEGETQSYVGQGDIDTFTQTKQSDEFEVTASPGSYYLSVLAANLSNWHIEVFDYY